MRSVTPLAQMYLLGKLLLPVKGKKMSIFVSAYIWREVITIKICNLIIPVVLILPLFRIRIITK